MKEMEVEYDFIPVDVEWTGGQQMQGTGKDAVQLLIADHRKVQDLFKKVEKTQDIKQKRELAKKIDLELRVHSKVEELLVYPELMKEDEQGADESKTEHALVEYMLNDIQKLNSRQKTDFEAKLCVLKELVEHHIKEEEGQYFPELKKAGVDLVQIGMMIEQKKPMIMKQIQQKLERGQTITDSEREAGMLMGSKRTSARKAASTRKASNATKSGRTRSRKVAASTTKTSRTGSSKSKTSKSRSKAKK